MKSKIRNSRKKSKITRSDESIPEEDRIYSPNKTCWCRKTTKESVDLLFRNIEQMKKDMITRGTQRVVPPREYWHIKCGKELPVKNGSGSRMDVDYIYDEKNGGYRMYTYDTKYGERKEIIFDKDKQCFTIKNLDGLRKKWNDAHKDKVKRDIDRCFDEFSEEKL